MEYLEPELLEGFRTRTREQLGEAINFAVSYHTVRGDSDIDELRQAAQDALSEILPEIVSAIKDAYKRSEIGVVDYAAMEILFRQLAVRVKLDEHISSGKPLALHTRKGTRTGIILSVREHEDQEQIELKMADRLSANNILWIPLTSVQGVS